MTRPQIVPTDCDASGSPRRWGDTDREEPLMTATPTTTRPGPTTPVRRDPGAAPTRSRQSLSRIAERLRDDRGSATAEYAVVILAAVAFAGVLVAVMRSGEVQSALSELVRGALSL